MMRKAYIYSSSTKNRIKHFETDTEIVQWSFRGRRHLVGDLGKSVTSNDIVIQTSAVVGDQ